jgi:hypothetical protein
MIAPDSEDLLIVVNGQRLAGWQEFEVYRGAAPSGENSRRISVRRPDRCVEWIIETIRA